MADKEKQPHLVITVGYLGFIFFLLAGLRYILIIEDQMGRLLMAFSSGFLWYYFQYSASHLLTNRKERKFFKYISIAGILIVFVYGSYLVLS